MGSGHIVSIVNIIGIGRMTHSGGCTYEGQLLCATHHRNFTYTVKVFCQFETYGKLL